MIEVIKMVIRIRLTLKIGFEGITLVEVFNMTHGFLGSINQCEDIQVFFVDIAVVACLVLRAPLCDSRFGRFLETGVPAGLAIYLGAVTVSTVFGLA